MLEKNLTLHFIITEIKMVIFLQRIVKICYTNSQTPLEEAGHSTVGGPRCPSLPRSPPVCINDSGAVTDGRRLLRWLCEQVTRPPVCFCLQLLDLQCSLPALPGGVQAINYLPAMQETWVWSVGQEDPLEKGTATHSSILAWRIPRTGERGGLQSMGSHRVSHDWTLN